MSKRLESFVDGFSYYIASEAPIRETSPASWATLRNFGTALISYIPLINTISNIFLLKVFSGESVYYSDSYNLSSKALKARRIICATGLGIVLLPVDIIGTLVKAWMISKLIKQWKNEAMSFLSTLTKDNVISPDLNDTDATTRLNQLNDKIQKAARLKNRVTLPSTIAFSGHLAARAYLTNLEHHLQNLEKERKQIMNQFSS